MKRLEIFEINNKKPIREWMDSLKDKTIKARVAERLNRLLNGNFGEYKEIDYEISELKLKIGAGYRIYYSEINDIVVLLLCGGDKSTQNKDIKKAKKYLQIWKDNNNEQMFS